MLLHMLFLILMLLTIFSSDFVLKSFSSPPNHDVTGFPFSYEPVDIGFMNPKEVRDIPERKQSLWLLN